MTDYAGRFPAVLAASMPVGAALDRRAPTVKISINRAMVEISNGARIRAITYPGGRHRYYMIMRGPKMIGRVCATTRRAVLVRVYGRDMVEGVTR